MYEKQTAAVAIITARGGSKRIPKKNIKNFCGKPILAYSIEAALQSGCFDEVMVSTDDEEIADVARKFGAKIPFMRSEKTSDDYATTADVLEEVLDCYQNLGQNFDELCCIYPTAPFLTAETLRSARAVFRQSGAWSLMPVVRYSFPPQRAQVIRDGYLNYMQPEHRNTRSQDLEPIYHDCGQFYFCDTKRFYAFHSMVTPKTVPFVVPELNVQDIDNLTDWKLAELKFQLLLSMEK